MTRAGNNDYCHALPECFVNIKRVRSRDLRRGSRIAPVSRSRGYPRFSQARKLKVSRLELTRIVPAPPLQDEQRERIECPFLPVRTGLVGPDGTSGPIFLPNRDRAPAMSTEATRPKRRLKRWFFDVNYDFD